MAEKTEKKRKFKELTDAEKYQLLKRGAIKAGKIVLGAAVLTGAGVIVYNAGKHAGEYDCLEYLYHQFPECAETIATVDPAFFTTLDKTLA